MEHLDKKILVDQLMVDDAALDNYVLIGGWADFSSMVMIANSYRDRADDLVEVAINNKDIAYEYTFPILFLYRHSLELYLKTLSPKTNRSHKFDSLINNLRIIASKRLPSQVLKELLLRLNEFKDIDNRSTRFRYGQELGEEYLINLNQLRLTFNDIVSVIRELPVNSDT